MKLVIIVVSSTGRYLISSRFYRQVINSNYCTVSHILCDKLFNCHIYLMHRKSFNLFETHCQ